MQALCLVVPGQARRLGRLDGRLAPLIAGGPLVRPAAAGHQHGARDGLTNGPAEARNAPAPGASDVRAAG